MARDLREIRRKITTITNIRQITGAMKMVAAAKLSRVRSRIDDARAYWDALEALVAEVAGQAETVSHPLLEPGDAETIGVVIIGGERGLCGSYNLNLNRRADTFLQQVDRPTRIWVVGEKARNFLDRSGYELYEALETPGEANRLDVALRLSQTVRQQFLDGELGEVRVIYTEFYSPIRHRPVVEPLLPISPAGREQQARRLKEYIFEPPAEELLGALLPRAVDSAMYRMLLESTAAEQGARSTAMTAATDNANEMLEDLTRERNRARQTEITREILDVIGGAEALRR